jgi:uncharacterized protein with von Willebrand factor type A (vWA) domain
MLLAFFDRVRAAGVPATVGEYLSLLEGLQAGVCSYDVEDFYHFARLCLVKHESHFDRFDRAFADYFDGVQSLTPEDPAHGVALPEAWLRSLGERFLSAEQRAEVAALGGFDRLMATLRQRLAEQQGRHEGGSKWIGTRGTSPFGADGYHPEGVRIGQAGSRHRRAVKVWDQREFRDFDGAVELGTRNLKIALRRLRRLAREGPPEILDLGGTLRATADNAGFLDIRLMPEWRNRIKILLFLDVGGSMDEHVRSCEALFTAARSEFRHLEHFYFHNFVYEAVWKNNARRRSERVALWDLMHKYGRDWRLILVGDAHMSPYEITEPGGSVDHWNEEPGRVWLERLIGHFPRHVWLNPMAEQDWSLSSSIPLAQQLLGGRMQPLTLDGIDRAARLLG